MRLSMLLCSVVVMICGAWVAYRGFPGAVAFVVAGVVSFMYFRK